VFKVLNDTVVQADGEPFRQPPGQIKISKLPEQVSMLVQTKKDLRRISQAE